MSVHPSVRPSVTLYFFFVFRGLFSHCSCPNDQIQPLPTRTRLGLPYIRPCFNSSEQNSNFSRWRWDGLDQKSEGAFLVIDSRVSKGPLGGLLYSFARTAHSAHSAQLLHNALLRSLRFTILASLASFAHSLYSRVRSLILLTPSWDSCNSCVHAVTVFNRNNRVCCRQWKHALRSEI